MKRQWVTPKLLIMARSTPEENVLAACKYNAAPMLPGYPLDTTDGHGCQASKDKSCQACQSLGGGGS